MLFDPENPIVKLCAAGMEQEGLANGEAALKLFEQAWDEARNDLERVTAAHYIARHQKSIAEKLHWDEIALNLALKVDGNEIKSTYSSLYLNIAKCHEDMGNYTSALAGYESANKFIAFLPDDGYGNMIRSGTAKGIERVKGFI